MKKFIIKILVFFIFISLIDVLFGFACQFLNNNSKGGGTKSRYYVCKESTEDVLVFGSSRAKHHYVPDIIEDSLHLSCYNVGEDGNGIILSFGFLKMITKRYSPRLIIYDITRFDMVDDDNMKYLDLLKPYYYEPGIDSIFWSINPKTRIMMISNLYRYNTTCLRLLGNYIHPMTNYPKGYHGLTNTMDYETEELDDFKRTDKMDPIKITFFEKFIELTKNKGITLVCCVSPYYKDVLDDVNYDAIIQLCNHYDVPFINYGTEVDYKNNKSYYQDRTHMNDIGARHFTQKLTNDLKQSVASLDNNNN